MGYLNSYFEDEVREGFYVPGMVNVPGRCRSMSLRKLKRYVTDTD